MCEISLYKGPDEKKYATQGGLIGAWKEWGKIFLRENKPNKIIKENEPLHLEDLKNED